MKHQSRSAPSSSSESIRETIDKQQVVLRHLETMSKLTVNPLVSSDQYNTAVSHLEGMLHSLQDDKYRENLKKLTEAHRKREEALEKPWKFAVDKGNFDGAESLKNKLQVNRNIHFQLLFRELNALADRKGIGWTREGIADFTNYRAFVKKNGRPGEAQERFAEQIGKEIKDNIHVEERNWICLVMGKVGSGKSYTAMSIAKKFDPGFNLSRVCFDEESFMELIRSNLPKGSFIIADEIGSWLGSREYMTTTNRILSYVIQTFRNLQLGILWTVPQRRMVDLNLRSMADHTIETVDLWRETNKSLFKLKSCHVNPMTGNEMTPFPELTDMEGLIRVTRCTINRPGQIEFEYESKKRKWQNEMYEQSHEILKRLGGNGGLVEKKVTKKDEIIKHLEEDKTVHWIAKKLDTAPRYVKEIRQFM